MRKLQNFVRVIIVRVILKLLFLFFINLTHAEDIKKIEYEEGYCFQTDTFKECFFNNKNMIGSINSEQSWTKNVKISKENQVSYYFMRNQNEIAYGMKYFDDGYYVGDLSSDGSFYGRGSYYFDNGNKFSFQNWHEDKKIGYKQDINGSKISGRFDQNNNIIIGLVLDSDFQLQLNEIENKARLVKLGFYSDYGNFLSLKRGYLQENLSSKNKTNTIIQNNAKKPKIWEQNLVLVFLIIFIFIVIILWTKANPSLIKQTESTKPQSRKSKIDKKERFYNLSKADSKKLYSYGVKEYMSVPEACKQLRSEYFKWTTVSNNTLILKKRLSQKNMNNIIKLRKKLEC